MAVHYKAQRICHPLNGDFGITKKYGGNWLCEGGNVSFDGKHWVASLTYLYSPTGWDTDLYDND